MDLDTLRKDEKEDNDEIDMGSDDDDRDESEEKLNGETEYFYRLDKEFDMAHAKYLIETKNKEARSGTKMDKRKETNLKQRTRLQTQEDEDLVDS